MQFSELKASVLVHMSAEFVREAFGDLRRRETWEVAADRCCEYAAAAMDVAVETAAPVAAAIAKVFTYDNLTAFLFPAAVIGGQAFDLLWQATRLVGWSTFYVLYAIGSFAFHLGALYGEDHYAVRRAALLIGQKDLLGVRPADGAELVCHLDNPNQATHRYAVRLCRKNYDSKLIDLLVDGGGFAELREAIRKSYGQAWKLDTWELVWEDSI
jgi:hypothetical protein